MEEKLETRLYEYTRLVQGLRVATTLAQVRDYAFASFDKLDADGDGFVTKSELQNAIEANDPPCDERAYIGFLLRLADTISQSYQEEWNAEADGISRPDLQEYFKNIISRTIR